MLETEDIRTVARDVYDKLMHQMKFVENSKNMIQEEKERADAFNQEKEMYEKLVRLN
jgi:hypothetical protein